MQRKKQDNRVNVKEVTRPKNSRPINENCISGKGAETRNGKIEDR